MIFTQFMSEYVTMKYVKFHRFSLTFKDFTAIVSSDKFFCAHLICMNIYALSYECFVEVCVQLEWQPTQRVQGCHSNWTQTSTKYEGNNAIVIITKTLFGFVRRFKNREGGPKMAKKSIRWYLNDPEASDFTDTKVL